MNNSDRYELAIRMLLGTIEEIESEVGRALHSMLHGDREVAIHYLQKILKETEERAPHNHLRGDTISEQDDVQHDNKILRERLEAAKYLIEGLQDKLEAARRRVADYDMVVSQRNFYFSECERLKGEPNENHK